MKRSVILAVLLCLFSAAAYAQTTPDFSGEWTMDRSKSTLPDRMRGIEGMTLKIEHKEKKLKVTRETLIPTQTKTGGGGPAIINVGGNKTTETNTCSLEGKENRSDSTGPMGGDSLTVTTAKFNGDILELITTRTMDSPMGTVTMVIRDSYELLADGTLKVKRSMQSNSGNQTAELIFVKKVKK